MPTSKIYKPHLVQKYVPEHAGIPSDVSGNGSISILMDGFIGVIDVVLVDSASLDITISRVMPDNSELTIYSQSGVVSDLHLSRDALTPAIHIPFSGNLKFSLANAGNHAEAVRVYLTVV